METGCHSVQASMSSCLHRPQYVHDPEVMDEQQSLVPAAVRVRDVIRDVIMNCLLMLRFVSANPLTAVFLQEGNTVLMSLRSGHFSRAIPGAVLSIHVSSFRYEELNRLQITGNRGNVESCSPFMVVGSGDAYAMR